MQNAVCLNLYCVFLMRSRPDWIRKHCALIFLSLSLCLSSSLSLILPQRVLWLLLILIIDKNLFCGTFFTAWRMFVKHELVVKGSWNYAQVLGGVGGSRRWGGGVMAYSWLIYCRGFGDPMCCCLFVFICFSGAERGWRGDSCEALLPPASSAPWFWLA